MEYKYMYRQEEVFSQYIHTMDHYLFDAQGRFVSMLPAGDVSLQSQRLDLQPGTYTMVAIGNPSDRVRLEGHLTEGLEGFLLSVLSQSGAEREAFRCGELYGGWSRFTVTAAPSQRFVTEMSNLHCQLDVRVEWELRPPGVGDYRLVLWNVPCRYGMDSETLATVSGYAFPSDKGVRDRYEVAVPLKSQTLTGSFVTLRYTSACVPSLRVFFGEEACTPELDLTRAFQQWGWSPDRETVQHYRIKVVIRSDGSVAVRPWVEGDVSDWIDGGTFS